MLKVGVPSRFGILYYFTPWPILFNGLSAFSIAQDGQPEKLSFEDCWKQQTDIVILQKRGSHEILALFCFFMLFLGMGKDLLHLF